jgi:hypothetical protein
LVQREKSSSPSCARNAGVACSTGDLLCFLDGDDLFFPNHLYECYRALEDSGVSFVKTGVRLADPVHPDWRGRIESSVVLNLCVRRSCHDFLGGFLDLHLFRRDGDAFDHQTDIFYKVEDQFYNLMLDQLFRGARVETETVEYCRYPGNSYDKQYEKFRQPYGACAVSDADSFRITLAGLLVQDRIDSLKKRLEARSLARGDETAVEDHGSGNSDPGADAGPSPEPSISSLSDHHEKKELSGLTRSISPTAPRIVYLSWPSAEISGGIKMAFRHVEALLELGFRACIATEDAKAPTWFQTNAPIIPLTELAPSDDVLVFPENHAGILKKFAPWKNRKVVFCQNQYKIHRGLDGREDYGNYGVHYLICPGRLAAAICSRRCPKQRIFLVPYPVDPGIFHPRETKKLQIAFAPRKRSQEALFIHDLFCAENPGLRSIPWVQIDGHTETQVADILGESILYLALLRFEAVPLSALEALASGCLVAGFTGFGGREYATPTNGFWAAEDDTVECVDQLTRAVHLASERSDRYRDMIEEGLCTARLFNREKFQTHLKACWGTILNS